MQRQRVMLPIEDFGTWTPAAARSSSSAPLHRVPGVLHIYANAATELAYVQYDGARCDVHDLVRAVKRAGFHAGVPVPS